MALSPQADDILAALSRDHGLKTPLRLDEGGYIPIRLGNDLDIGIAFSGANNSFYLAGPLDAGGRASPAALWRVFRRTGRLAERRTRIGLDPASGQALLIRDVFLQGLAYPAFAAILETFAADLEATAAMLREAEDAAPSAAVADEAPALDGFMIFRA